MFNLEKEKLQLITRVKSLVAQDPSDTDKEKLRMILEDRHDEIFKKGPGARSLHFGGDRQLQVYIGTYGVENSK